MKFLDWVSLTLVIIGALNWGLKGFFDFDFVNAVFGNSFGFVSRIIFAIVGLAGLYCLSIYGRLDAVYSSNQIKRQH